MSKTGLELAKLTTEDSLPKLRDKGDLIEFLNRQPADEWLEKTPDGKANTMPIGRVEWLLTNLFQEWYVEVIKTETMFNSLVCTVRVFYKDPIDQTFHHQDGVGAAPAKTAKGASAADMSAILNDSVQTGLPAAKSFAIKDACDHIGRIFGRDINRKGTFAYTNPYADDENQKLLDQFASAETPEQIDDLLSTIPADQQLAYAQVAKNRLKELKHAAVNG